MAGFFKVFRLEVVVGKGVSHGWKCFGPQDSEFPPSLQNLINLGAEFYPALSS